MRVQPHDAEYAQGVAAEAAFWNKLQMYSLEALEKVLADGPIERYINRRFTGKPNVQWEDTIARHGDFRRGLALGTGAPSLEARILKSNSRLHLTLVDLSEGALERHRNLLSARYPGRVTTCVGDLNFIELEEASYDLIVSSGTIHHVVNLEYLAFQINHALTNDGYFFLQDYVAEPRWRFSEEKRRIFETFVARYMQDNGRPPGVVWESEDTLSPFCGVRSDETLSVFEEFLELQEVRTAGALLGPMMRSKCAAAPPSPARWHPRRIAFVLRARLRRLVRARAERMLDTRFIEDLTLMSDTLEDAGVIRPNTAFAVYRKRLR